jgi:hypothetical protein
LHCGIAPLAIVHGDVRAVLVGLAGPFGLEVVAL